MSEKTNIEWATSTFNPWIGCTKVSPGCANCYAEISTPSRALGVRWGKGQPRRRTSEAYWKKPFKWASKASCDSDNAELMRNEFVRPRVFPSLCDWLDDEVPIEWLADFLNLIVATPSLDWLLLTKRPQLAFDRVNAATRSPNYRGGGRLWNLAGCVPHNVWVGVSVEDQKRADERIPLLRDIPAKVHFLSGEPLLSTIKFRAWKCVCGYECSESQLPKPLQCPKCHLTEGLLWHSMLKGIDWVIIGGESGPNRRDCGVDAIEDIARQCLAAKVPCFVKQDVGQRPGMRGRISDDIWKLKQIPNEKSS